MGIEVKRKITRKSQSQKEKDKEEDMKVREADKGTNVCCKAWAKQGHTEMAHYRKRQRHLM